MKAMQCELCGSTDIVKEGDFFVCQSCGMKYSPESAKTMMVEGVVQVEGTVKVDKSSEISHYLELANSMLESGNWKQAEEYAAKTLEISTDNPRAWLVRGHAAFAQSTFKDDKFPEMIACFKKAISKIDDDLKTTGQLSSDQDANVYLQVHTYALTAVQDRIKTWSKAFAQSPGDEDTRDWLTVRLPDYLRRYGLLMAQLENTFRGHEETLKTALLSLGVHQDEIDKVVKVSCTCFDDVGKIYYVAIGTVLSDAVEPAIKNVVSVVESTKDLVAEYKAIVQCEPIKGHIIDVIDAMDRLCDAPCVAYCCALEDTDAETLGVALQKYRVAEVKISCLETYEELIKRKNAIAKAANTSQDLVGLLCITAEKIAPATAQIQWGFERRKIRKVRELVEEKNQLTIDDVKEKAYQQAFEEYPSTHPRETAEYEQNKMQLPKVEDRIDILMKELASLGIFSGGRKKQINSEISSLTASRTHLFAAINSYDNQRKKYADTLRTAASKEAKRLSVNLKLGEGFLLYDVHVILEDKSEALDEFADFVWKKLQIPISRYRDSFKDGEVELVKKVTFEYVSLLMDIFENTNYRLELKPHDYEHIDNGFGYSVVIENIDNISGGSNEEDPDEARAKRRKTVARSVAYYVPINISEYEQTLTLPKIIATDLPEKIAFALAGDLETRGAKVRINHSDGQPETPRKILKRVELK